MHREEALAYRDEVRAKMPLVFGEMPEKTPLNLRVTRENDRGEYLIRNVIFEAAPASGHGGHLSPAGA